jgi:alkaline phosphatase
MKKLLYLMFSGACVVLGGESRAKNVILFLGDAGGLSTLNAAGIYGHDRPQSLYIQKMDHIALSDTSSLDSWVTDSAAGMTAIVSGQKTNNYMLSLLPAIEGTEPRPLKTILEYAEERGLATGVITNMPVWDATPAACYAHIISRKSSGEIFSQLLHPRFGDGVDVIIGADKKGVVEAAQKLGLDANQALKGAGYQVFDSPGSIPADVTRAASIYDGPDFIPGPVVTNVVKILSRNPKGFFLMVEWDMHTDNLEKGLKRALVMDAMIKRVAEEAPADTLILFAADHSFDVRLRGGKKDTPVTKQRLVVEPGGTPLPSPVFRVDGGHTGEEILVAAQGPGSERVHGFIPNTELFHIMLKAYGWPESP